MIHTPFKYKPATIRPLAILGGDAGFTLAELVMAMGIMVIVVAAIISVFTSLNRMYTAQGVAAGVQQVARTGIDIMTRNIRMAGFNPLNISGIGIREATSNSIRFESDTDEDGTIATNGDEDIAYRLTNSQLVQQKNGNGNRYPLIDNVSALTFNYFDEDGETVIGDPAAIRSVEVSLTVEEPAGRDRVVRRTYSTRVICRNLSL
jgi:type IV pilus assembly protein PilW